MEESKLKMVSLSTLENNDICNAPEQTIICTTNTVGAMGRGIALSVKLRWRKVYLRYMKHHKAGELKPDFLFTVEVDDNKQVLLFPTKQHWLGKAKVPQIVSNLEQLADRISDLGIESIAIPPLGMGNGWLSYEEGCTVMSAIHKFANTVAIPCTFYYPED